MYSSPPLHWEGGGFWHLISSEHVINPDSSSSTCSAWQHRTQAENHDVSSKILSSRNCLLFRAEVCNYLQIFKTHVSHIPSERVKTDGNLNTGRDALARVAFPHPDAHVQCAAPAALSSGWATWLAAITSRVRFIFFLAQAGEVHILRSQGQCYSQWHSEKHSTFSSQKEWDLQKMATEPLQMLRKLVKSHTTHVRACCMPLSHCSCILHVA